MMRIALAATVTVFFLGACASTSSSSHYTVTPKVQVTVKSKSSAPQANYQASPEDSKPTGSAGSVK